MTTPITSVSGIGAQTAEILVENGFADAESLAAAKEEDLLKISGFGPARAKKLIEAAQALVGFGDEADAVKEKEEVVQAEQVHEEKEETVQPSEPVVEKEEKEKKVKKKKKSSEPKVCTQKLCKKKKKKAKAAKAKKKKKKGARKKKSK